MAAGWWVAIVELTPASARPYIGGSTSNSVLQLTFGYNGLGRITGNETGSVGFGNGTGSPFGGAPRLTRLFGAEMGGQASWLIPAALIALAALLWSARRAPRTDRTRAAMLVWGGWLLVTAAVFSFMAGIIHPYYTVALAPAIGGLVGIGGAAAWRARGHLAARATLAAAIAVSAAWSYVLLDRSPGWYPWLRGLVLAAGLAAVIGLFAGDRLTRPGAAASRGATRAAAAGVASLALIGVLAGPVAYSLETAATPHAGAIPSAGPAVTTAGGGPGGFGGQTGRGAGAAQNGPGGQGFTGSRGIPGGAGPAAGIQGGQPGAAGGLGGAAAAGGQPGGGLGGATQVSSAMVSLLHSGAPGYRWAAAIVGATSASSLQLISGEPIMAIGGFNGTDPAPTLASFEKMVAAHEIHYFVAAQRGGFGGSSSGASAQITSWVEQHFSSSSVGGYTVYDLSAPGSSG